MNQLCSLACFVMLSFVSLSQGYEIKSLGTEYSSLEIKNAFDNANLCGYHFESVRNTIVLDDGAQIEFLAGSELSQISANCLVADGMVLPVCKYSISSGVVLRSCEYEPSPQKKKELLQNSNN